MPSNPTKTYTYTYDGTWKDKLASYDGKVITYDAIGNPLTYDGWTYTWQMGRQLVSATKTGTAAAFKYNDAGIRTEKTVNGVTTKYHLINGRVTCETNNAGPPDTIYYTYGSAGALTAMTLNGTTYYYIRNGQGDITGLFDSSGTQVVSYTYDTWGKLISTTGSLASTVGLKNPYRYRGYRYDVETGLYYCQSRYYNPEWGRWLNADGSIGQQGQLLSHNLFAYCYNNPVNMIDPKGDIAWWIIGGIIGAVAGGIIGGIASDWDWRYILAGAAAGGLVGIGAGWAAEAVYTGIIGAGGGVVLWSGGQKLRDIAAQFASNNGFKTLEQKASGKILSCIQNIANSIFGSDRAYDILRPLWDSASLRFVQGAENQVHVFLNSAGISDMSVFMRIKYQYLKEKGVELIFHLVNGG